MRSSHICQKTSGLGVRLLSSVSVVNGFTYLVFILILFLVNMTFMLLEFLNWDHFTYISEWHGSIFYLEGEWYCSGCTSQGQKRRRKGGIAKKPRGSVCAVGDHIQEYSRALTWDGLLHMVRKDAEREGHGPVLMALWRHDMPLFLSNSHPKYMTTGHRLLCGN